MIGAVSDNKFAPSLDGSFFACKRFMLQVLCKAAQRCSWVIVGLLAALLFPLPPYCRQNEQLPLFPDFVKNLITDSDPLADDGSFPPQKNQEPKDLRAAHVVGRVLHYLYAAEEKEADPHYRSDLRIAWCLTLYCHREDPEPMLLAWRAVLNCRPEEVWPRILANRQRRLGSEFADWYTADGTLKPETVFGASSPKKPVQSVRDPRARRTA